MQSVDVDSQDASERRFGRDAGARAARVAWSSVCFRHYLLQLASLGIFLGGGLVVTLVSIPLRWVLGSRRSSKFGQQAMGGLFRFFVWWLRKTGLFQVRFEGFERVQSMGGVIFASNHPGLLDAIVLIGRLPRAVCIMRASLMKNFSMSGAARLAGYITNDQGHGMIRRCLEKVAEGNNLLIFPEGTRTHEYARGVNRFKAGCALVSVAGRVPIQTIIIEQQGRYLAKDSGMLKPASVPIRLHVRLGEVFKPAVGESAKALAARLESYFRDQLTARRDDGHEA